MSYIGNYLIIKLIIVISAAVVTSRVCITMAIRILEEAGCSTINYKNNSIAAGVGIAFIPTAIAVICLSLILFPKAGPSYLYYMFSISTIGFVGLLDDLIGEKKIKGLKNHLKSSLHGHLTTGFIKAFVGVLIAFAVAYVFYEDILNFILDIAIIALFTNALNILDLRPGRCAKFFILTGAFILFGNLNSLPLMIPLAIMLTTAVIYIRFDLKELCMLGDTGSNILGITLGFYSTVGLELLSKTVVFAFLLAVHITAEKVSITKLIEKNKLLNYLDSLGRSS